jgi:hypothetical protein
MAEEHVAHVFTRGGRAKYPWDKWMNGSPWLLHRGTEAQRQRGERDFSVEARILRGIAANYAFRHRLVIETEIPDKDTVWIRCIGEREDD